MPTVLITGLNGFVAVHTALVYLSNGFSVNGTFRSQSKADKTLALPVFASYVKEGKIKSFIVEDLIKGDFTKALEGVEIVAHCASPWHFSGKSWAEYRDPAVEGTTKVLEQAAGVPSVKAVAVISSFAAIGSFATPAPTQKDKVYTEEDWNPWTEVDCQGAEQAYNAGDAMMLQVAPIMWYASSKKFAEIAARGVQKRLNPNYTLVTINPPMIFGPALHYGQATADDLKSADMSTTQLFASLVAGKDAPLPDSAIPVWADVRNVAQAMYEGAVQRKNDRYIICNGNFDFQILANIAREKFPELAALVPLGKPDEPTPLSQGSYKLDGSKAAKELGIKYTSLEDMVVDTVKQFVQTGAVKA